MWHLMFLLLCQVPEYVFQKSIWVSIDYEVVQQSCVWLKQVLTKYLVILLFKAFIHEFIYQTDSGYIYIQALWI